ncbi:hypothetical protein J3Q64DRAFT_1817208, partial [Phycomyces blakesleeanus]
MANILNLDTQNTILPIHIVFFYWYGFCVLDLRLGGILTLSMYQKTWLIIPTEHPSKSWFIFLKCFVVNRMMNSKGFNLDPGFGYTSHHIVAWKQPSILFTLPCL